jgi:hypothetical protein
LGHVGGIKRTGLAKPSRSQKLDHHKQSSPSLLAGSDFEDGYLLS